MHVYVVLWKPTPADLTSLIEGDAALETADGWLTGGCFRVENEAIRWAEFVKRERGRDTQTVIHVSHVVAP